RPLSGVGRLWRWVRRKPAEAALAVTALALVGLALAGARSVELRQAEGRTETARQEGRGSQAGGAVFEQKGEMQQGGRGAGGRRRVPCWRERRACWAPRPRQTSANACAGRRWTPTWWPSWRRSGCASRPAGEARRRPPFRPKKCTRTHFRTTESLC